MREICIQFQTSEWIFKCEKKSMKKANLTIFFNEKVMCVSISICTTNLIFNWINDVWARIFLPTHIAFDEVSHIFILKKNTFLKTLFRVLIFMTFCNKNFFFHFFRYLRSIYLFNIYDFCISWLLWVLLLIVHAQITDYFLRFCLQYLNVLNRSEMHFQLPLKIVIVNVPFRKLSERNIYLERNRSSEQTIFQINFTPAKSLFLLWNMNEKLISRKKNNQKLNTNPLKQ